MKDEATASEKTPKVMAVLEIQGKTKVISDATIHGLRRKLKEYPANALITVWRGRQLPVKRELKAVF